MLRALRTMCIVVALLDLSAELNAQGRRSGIQIHVTDSVSNIPLVGARIQIICGPDTTMVATDERGEVHFMTTFRADSLDLTVYFLGYARKQHVMRSPPAGQIHLVRIPLAQTVQEIAEIVVVGKEVAMVVKGDTVKFNAGAFKTFLNDPMSALFEALPGMTFENGVLTFMGESVQRITIDGKHLFNDHVGLALASIRADDVIDIQVYKTVENPDDLKSTGMKRQLTVADVRTRSKPTYVHKTQLDVNSGMGLDAGHRPGRQQLLYDASGKLISSRVGTTLAVGGDSNNLQSNPTGFGVANADATYSLAVPDKFDFSTQNNTTRAREVNDVWVQRSYFPNERYTARHYRRNDSTENNNKRLSSKNKFSYRLPDRSIIGATGEFSYGTEKGGTVNSLLAGEGDTQLQSQRINDRQKLHASNLSAAGTYTRAFTTKSRSSVTLNTVMENSAGNNTRIDTSFASTQSIYKEGERSNWKQKNGITISNTYTPTANLSVSISDVASFTRNDIRRTTQDLITGLVDPINSLDYRYQEFNNTLTTTWSYSDFEKERGWVVMQGSASWELKEVKRMDYFPQEIVYPRTFNLFGIYVNAEYKLGGFNTVKFRYSILPAPTTVEHFRPLDDTNPMLLQTGNPNLKTVNRHSFSVTANMLVGSSVYKWDINLHNEKNFIVTRSIYVDEDTFLEEYDYVALAGATVITHENRDGHNSFFTSISKDARISRLKMTMRAGLHYGFDNTPVYWLEAPVPLRVQRYGFRFSLQGAFSSTITPSIELLSRFHDRRLAGTVNHSQEHRTVFSLRIMAAKSVELESHNQLHWYRWRPRIPNANQVVYVSNLDMNFLFDKEGDFKLKFSVKDLANRPQRIRFRMDNDYQEESYRHLLGRYVTAGLAYTF